eukprot:scaffold31794_cov107-Isochrysis_galbana.AAC.15
MGPTLYDIRDSDMGAAITYLLLELEGVDAELDILDDGKKGPWTIFSTSERVLGLKRFAAQELSPFHC